MGGCAAVLGESGMGACAPGNQPRARNRAVRLANFEVQRIVDRLKPHSFKMRLVRQMLSLRWGQRVGVLLGVPPVTSYGQDGRGTANRLAGLSIPRMVRNLGILFLPPRE